MIFKNHLLAAPLDKHIESIFHFKNFMPEHSVERVVPTGHMFLLFELDGFPRNTFDNRTLTPNAVFTNAWVSGMHRNYISISAHQNSEMFVAQFKAAGAYPFLHMPAHLLAEKILPAEEIFGAEILELRNKILTAGTSEEKFELAENWLKKRFDESNEPPSHLMSIINQLQKEPVSNFNKIAKSYPYSQKHLIEQFKKYVGITPKYYHRILRFNDILQKIKQQEKISWAQTAYQCGYSDQSHFIKEFKHFSGFNPQEFIKQPFTKEEANFFPLDRQG